MDAKQDDTASEDLERRRKSSAVIIGLQRQVDERDETIRLLNEALSRALEDLERGVPLRAA